jgi:hypothetical protein
MYLAGLLILVGGEINAAIMLPPAGRVRWPGAAVVV